MADRFWPKVGKVADGCWLWTAAKYKNGYGKFGRSFLEGVDYAHRVAWELANNQRIPEGMVILHQCDSQYAAGDFAYRACVRPDHLMIGTQSQNILDSVNKGRFRPRRGPL